MEAAYEVLVTKDFLVFSAAHFITFAGDQCERLHGHNYRVEVAATGPLDENAYVVDFLALRDAARELTDRLDHRMLLPTQSERIRVSESGGQVTARFEDRTWSFPAEECVLLPVSNTTAELLARWLGERVLQALAAKGHPRPATLTVRVEENFGQRAACTLTPEER